MQKVDSKRLAKWRGLIGKKVKHEKRVGPQPILYLYFEEIEVPMGNGFIGRTFVGQVVEEVSFEQRSDKSYTGSVYLSFDSSANRLIDVFDPELQETYPPEDAKE